MGSVPGACETAKQTAAEVAVMFPISRELCHICKTVLRSCSFIYPADEDMTGTETCHGKMSTWAFYEVSQDTDILVFQRRIKPLSWASKEPLQVVPGSAPPRQAIAFRVELF